MVLSYFSYFYKYFSESIWIKHERKLCTGDNAEYWTKRSPQGKEKKRLQKTIDKLWYQRNYLKCALDFFLK